MQKHGSIVNFYIAIFFIYTNFLTLFFLSYAFNIWNGHNHNTIKNVYLLNTNINFQYYNNFNIKKSGFTINNHKKNCELVYIKNQFLYSYIDKSSFLDKITHIQQWIENWISANSKPMLNGPDFNNTLNLMSEAFFFENIIDYLLLKYKENEDFKKLESLKILINLIKPMVIHRRISISEGFLKQLLAALLKGPIYFEESLKSINTGNTFIDHLLKLIDEKIFEASMSTNSSNSKAKFLLELIKNRFKAESLVSQLGTTRNINILAKCLYSLETCEERIVYIKSKIKKIEDLKDFSEWLDNGILYLEKTKKIPIQHLNIMKDLSEVLSAIDIMKFFKNISEI